MHKVKAIPENVHFGFYSAALKPILALRSGEKAEIDTSRCERVKGIAEPIRSEMEALADKKEREGCVGTHALTGPIYLEGAEPDALLLITQRQKLPTSIADLKFLNVRECRRSGW